MRQTIRFINKGHPTSCQWFPKKPLCLFCYGTYVYFCYGMIFAREPQLPYYKHILNQTMYK